VPFLVAIDQIRPPVKTPCRICIKHPVQSVGGAPRGGIALVVHRIVAIAAGDKRAVRESDRSIHASRGVIDM